MTSRTRTNPFAVNDLFEQELAAYTGAPYAVTVDSCTNALFLCFLYAHEKHLARQVSLPERTYVGVPQAALNAGLRVEFSHYDWQGEYRVQIDRGPVIIDSAKRFHRDMYAPGTLTCVSFQASKILPIGRGGAILTDDPDTADWLRKTRFDGRTAGDHCDTLQSIHQPGHHMYMTPPDAARGLWLLYYLQDDPDDQADTYPDLSQMEWR